MLINCLCLPNSLIAETIKEKESAEIWNKLPKGYCALLTFYTIDQVKPKMYSSSDVGKGGFDKRAKWFSPQNV